MATVIDALIVTLGLDNAGYMKRAKEAQAQQRKFRDDAKKTGNDVADALAAVGKQAAGLFLGFESIKGAIQWLGGLNKAQAELGRFATNLGQSAHEVNGWDKAVELAGGTAKDAEGDLQSLSQAVTNLKATGEVSPLLLLFQRLGVAIYDVNGKTRKFTDVYKDAGDKLRNFNRADAANLARNAGISDSTLNLIVKQGDEREKILALAEQENNVNDESIRQAQQLQQEWRGIGQTITRAGNAILSGVTPYVKEAFEWVQKLFNGATKNSALNSAVKILGGLLHSVWDVAKLALNGIELLFNSKAGKFIEKLFSKFLGTVQNMQLSLNDSLDDKVKDSSDAVGDQAAEAARKAAPISPDRKGTIVRSGAKDNGNLADNNNPGDLRFAGQRGAVAGAGGFAKFKTIADGIQAANRQLDLFAGRGINTIDSIVKKWAPVSENDTESYIKDVEKHLGIGRNKQLSGGDRQKLLSAIFGHEGVNKVSAGTIAGALLPNPGALGAAQLANGAAGGGKNADGSRTTNTDVRIDSITVHTQATDADGIATDIRGSIDRKGVVSQADTGMT